MKKFLLTVCTVRELLMKKGKSHLDEQWARQFIKQLRFWLSCSDVWLICEKHDTDLRILMPKTFINKYERLLKEHTSKTA